METYERLRQRVRRRSLRGTRLAKGSKPASVITNPAMEQHLRLGRKLLKEQENEKAFGEEALDDLLENILLYDVRLCVWFGLVRFGSVCSVSLPCRLNEAYAVMRVL